MAVDNPAVTFLSGLRSLGVDFSDTLTLGRQWLSADEEGLKQFLGNACAVSPAEFIRSSDPWADEFFRLLGVNTLSTMDSSDYEQASLIHDLNDPIDEKLREHFGVVHDGGTLEHVFNFPRALQSALEMVRLNGHFISITVANNYLGHGFYQFSPELYYRVLSPNNGYQVRCMLLHERIPNGRWFLVQDPKEYGRRVHLRNSEFTYLLVAAKRVSIKPIIEAWPHQSDYSAGYQGIPLSEASVRERSDLIGQIKKRIPVGAKDFVKRVLRYEPDSSFSESCFRPIAAKDVFEGNYPSGKLE